MKKYLAILLTLVSVGAYAGGNTSDAVVGAGFGRLTETEKAEVIKMVADKAASKSVPTSSTVTEEKVEKWVKIGAQIGQGMGSAARELGVAVSEFSTTPVGQLTMVLIVWHMIGSSLVHLVGGVLIWIVGFMFIRYVINRSYRSVVEYDTENKNIFGNYIVKSKQSGVIPSGDQGVYLFLYFVTILAGSVAIFTF